MSTLLSANEIRLAYSYQNLLDGVTLAVASGEKVGLVGRNGCGKTSLLKILTGESQADSGDISLRRGIRTGYLPQEFELDPDISVHENIAAGAADIVEAIRRYENGDGTETELHDFLEFIDHTDGWNLDARILSLSNALGTPPLEAPTGPLSGGEKRRVALCRALACQPDLLLLDEPTNHLDAESIRWLEDVLKNFAGAVIFVTHDRYFLDIIATRIIEIDGGKAYSHEGNYTAFLESKAIRQQIAGKTEQPDDKQGDPNNSSSRRGFRLDADHFNPGKNQRSERLLPVLGQIAFASCIPVKMRFSLISAHFRTIGLVACFIRSTKRQRFCRRSIPEPQFA